MTKTTLRALALGRRSLVGVGRRAAFAEALAHHGLALVQTFSGGRPVAVSAFLPIRGEPDTLPLLGALAHGGFPIALPATPPRGEPLRFRAWRPGDALRPGRFGTLEPPVEAAEVEPGVLFVPLAGFDRRGHRLGYGAGHYDGALARRRARGRVLAVGIAFAEQEVEAVPAEPHDERLDALVTDAGLLTFGPDPCASSSSAT